MPSRASNAALMVDSRAAADIVFPWEGRLEAAFSEFEGGESRRASYPLPLPERVASIDRCEPGEGFQCPTDHTPHPVSRCRSKPPSPARGEGEKSVASALHQPLQKNGQIVGDVIHIRIV